MADRTRLAVIVSHPIQHFVPFYRALAADETIELRVIFGAPIGVERYFDTEMQTEIAWQMDMTGGYPHIFLEPSQGRVEPGLFAPNSRKVWRELSRFAPDAVIVYGYAQINNLRGLAWCNAKRVPALMIGDSELLRPRGTIKSALRRLILPPLLGRMSAYLSVGDRNEDYYRFYGVRPDRIFRVPFTIDEEVYRAARTKRCALRRERRTALGIEEDEFVALFVGKLSPRKRPLDLATAVARLSGVCALFAGNGEEMPALKTLADNGHPILLPGFVGLDALPSFYAAADVLVHPSQADPHPLICSEAACVGLPMILSDRVGAVGTTDIARPGENAAVVPVGDIAALVSELDRLRHDRAKLDTMAARSREIFDVCDMSASVAGVHVALDRVLQKHRR